MRLERNHIDLLTLIAAFTLMVLSLGVVYSASSTWAMTRYGDSDWLLGRHATKVLIGFLTIFAVMHIDYHEYRKLSKPLLIVAVLLLIVTLGMGGEIKGATRWLRLGGLSFQPSEFAKYALVFHLCTLFVTKGERLRDFKTGFLPVMIWVGTVTVFILLQPNFSTGMMVAGISLVMLYLGRAKLLHVSIAGGTIIPLLIVYMLSAPYRAQRILAFFQGADAGNGQANYQREQGIIAFGNGGLFGLGPGGSRQRELFLPESYGDFVFPIIGEEYGLVGALFVILLFLVIMLRGMKIAKYARDEFGMLLAAGITTTITLYGLVNAAVTLGVLPTTGLPMPFVSYGGTSMMFAAFAVGVLLNISSQTDLHPRLSRTGDSVRPAEPAKPAVGRVF